MFQGTLHCLLECAHAHNIAFATPHAISHLQHSTHNFALLTLNLRCKFCGIAFDVQHCIATLHLHFAFKIDFWNIEHCIRKFTFETMHLQHYICNITVATLHLQYWIWNVEYEHYIVKLYLLNYTCNSAFSTLLLHHCICNIALATLNLKHRIWIFHL